MGEHPERSLRGPIAGLYIAWMAVVFAAYFYETVTYVGRVEKLMAILEEVLAR